MANKLYDNFVLANLIEDQYNSMLDLQQFCTVDNDLVGTPGMVKKIHKYSATDGTEKLTMGNGNTKYIETDYSEQEYRILLAQNQFRYYDEEEMTDPMVVQTGLNHMAVDMFNTVNKDVFAEFQKVGDSMTITDSKPGFGTFADAIALLNIEYTDNDPSVVAPMAFAFVNAKDVSTIRKNLAQELRYVEAFARTGYVGTVAGVNLYAKKDATEKEICGGTRAAVTLFNKKGVEVEQHRDADIRRNDIISRKYYLAALTDATKAFKIKIGTGA